MVVAQLGELLREEGDSQDEIKTQEGGNVIQCPLCFEARGAEVELKPIDISATGVLKHIEVWVECPECKIQWLGYLTRRW